MTDHRTPLNIFRIAQSCFSYLFVVSLHLINAINRQRLDNALTKGCLRAEAEVYSRTRKYKDEYD